MFSCGTLYLFPVYSPLLKRALGSTQEQLNSVGSAAHFGAFFSVFGGIFFDTYGSRTTLRLGGFLKVIGLLSISGVVAGSLPQNHTFAALCAWVYGTGCSTSLTAALGATYATFSDKTSHGKAAGLLLSFFSLSSGVLSLVYDLFFTSSLVFLQFLAVFAGFIDLYCSMYIWPPKNSTDMHNGLGDVEKPGDIRDSGAVSQQQFIMIPDFSSKARAEAKFTRGLAGCAVAAILVALSGILTGALSGTELSDLIAWICLLSLSTILTMQALSMLSVENSSEFVQQERHAHDSTMYAECRRESKVSTTPTTMVFSLEFYLLFAVMFFGLGSGMMLINNLPQLTAAYAYINSDASTRVAQALLKLFSCANTLGRLASGLISDRLAREKRMTREDFTVLSISMMTVGHAWLAYFVSEAHPTLGLSLGVWLVGWAFGSLFWALPTLVIEIFGPKYFGTNRGIVGLSPATGGYILSTVVAGRVYGANAEHGSECREGGSCYRTAFATNALITAAATVLCAFLANRRRFGLLDGSADQRGMLRRSNLHNRVTTNIDLVRVAS